MMIPVTVNTLTPLHLGSGRADVLIDADVVHDEYGLPYLPGKRFKGVLYESALEVIEMLEQCGKESIVSRETLARLFGRNTAESGLAIHDLPLKDYEDISRAWKYLQHAYAEVITPEDVLEEYTELRYQTKLDENGVTAQGSLHNMRVVDKGQTFVGEIELFIDGEKEQLLLALALNNLHYIGSKRNRGFGEIECQLTAAQKALIKRYL